MFPGIDPFSLLILATVADKVLLPVTLNVATGGRLAFLTLFKAKQKPVNHDLQKAIKTAYLQALLEIAQEFKSGKIKAFHLYVPTELDRKIKQWQDEIKHLATADSEAAIAPPFKNTAEIEQLLLSHGESSGDQIKELETRLVSKALQEIVDLPTDYQSQVQTRLFARVYAHFVEQLKTNKRAYDGFQISYLPMINASLTAIGTGQKQIALRMEDLFQGLEVTLERLKADVAEILARLDPQKPELTAAAWRTVGQMMFSDRQALTSNLFSSEDGVELKSLEVYVPLGLEERKERQRVQGDRTPEEFSQQQTTLTPISEDEFFTQILQPGQKSIAIIGEPGSGKTTRLQAVGDRIFRDHVGLPIWVSLGKLGNQSLGDYLRQWLRDATGHDSLWADFRAQFAAGRVWLLLDGLDEMTTRIDAQQGDLVRGWWSKAWLLLTCRGNVWDANRGALQDFAVYRNLDFSPAQVEDYIQRWFRAAGQEGAGTELQTALQQENHARLRDLVRHPLRLSLLCCAWHGGERSLPETQAGLYAQFVEQVYEWKATFIKTSPDQRRALQAKLSKLSLLAIEGKDTQGRAIPRFWFREGLVKRVFGGVDDPLCDLALRVGWLINLGKTAEKPFETAYGFYHATFQEYFAALGVEDWDYFLPMKHENSPVEGKKYRIFEPQWKQVILLWLGREDITDEEKEEFINKLVSFDDGCGEWNFEQVDKGFYEYRAYFLAAAGINEFKAYFLAAEIVREVVKWGFGYFNIEKQEWQTFLNPIKGGTRKTIPETIRQLVITELTDILEHCSDEYTFIQASESLGTINQGNSQAIAALITILETTEDEDNHWRAAWSLGEIGQGNPQAITGLIRILETTEDKFTCGSLSGYLEEIGQGNPQAITGLIRILETTDNEDTRVWAASSLGTIDQGNPQAITGLIRILETTDNEDNRVWTVWSLGKIGQGNPQAITALIRVLETTDNEDNHWRAAWSLGKIGQGNPQAITALIRILETTDNENTRGQAALSLGEIDPRNSQAIAALISILETTEDKNIRGRAASSLGKIGQGNPQAITGLIRILETTDNEDTRIQSANILGEIDLGNPQAIAALSRILETTKDEYILSSAGYNLGKTDPRNPQVIVTLIKILETTQNKFTRWKAVYSLRKILSTPEQYKRVILALKDCLSDEVHQNNFDRFDQCYKVLWECAANLPYPDFYHAWHSTPE